MATNHMIGLFLCYALIRPINKRSLKCCGPVKNKEHKIGTSV